MQGLLDREVVTAYRGGTLQAIRSQVAVHSLAD